MKTLILLQTAAPDYRKKVFQSIRENLGENFTLYSGSTSFEKSIKTDETINFLKPVKNHYFFIRKVLFQTGMWQDCLQCDVLILELNPRIISNWLLLIFRKTLLKKSVLWGHAWPRNGKKSSSDNIRNLMRILASEIIVYTKTQQKELETKMPYKKFTAAPNSLFYKSEMQVTEMDKKEITDIIFVGRLTSTKKPNFLVSAFIQIASRLPEKTNLIIVGEGEEKEILNKLVLASGLKKRIKILGHINDFTQLKELYAKSLFSVSPGYVGLSITQSFGFGVPMLISRNEKHSPEIEAAIENENSIFFKTDDTEDFCIKILDFFKKKNDWMSKRKKISESCRSSYSIENMSDIFTKLVK